MLNQANKICAKQLAQNLVALINDENYQELSFNDWQVVKHLLLAALSALE